MAVTHSSAPSRQRTAADAVHANRDQSDGHAIECRGPFAEDRNSLTRGRRGQSCAGSLDVVRFVRDAVEADPAETQRGLVQEHEGAATPEVAGAPNIMRTHKASAHERATD